jgi:hypothetical protein
MTTPNPITPPPELVEKWYLHSRTHTSFEQFWHYFATLAAHWGADQELEACCEWVDWKWSGIKSRELRSSRRPNPPSLKERALALVEQHEEGWRPSPKDWDTIRRALEALPDNTSQPS